MTGQFGFTLKIILSLWLILLCSATAHAAPVPTPKLNQALDLQQYFNNALRDEEVLELSNDDERFVALWLNQRKTDRQGGLLILHDRGQTPNWPFLLQQVRETMPDTGWSTLSIDLPTPQRDAIGWLPPQSETPATEEAADAPDWQTRVLNRVQTGIRELNNKGVFNIAILGYGDGGYWGARYLAENLTEEEEDGFALILVEAPLMQEDLNEYIAELPIPILDLYMSDSDFAHRKARERKASAARADHPDYLQIHDALRQSTFGKPDIDRTTRRVWGWLRNHAAGNEADVVDKPAF